MKATDKGLHDPIRTLDEAKAEGSLAACRERIHANLTHQGMRVGMIYVRGPDLVTVFNHIDTQAATIAELTKDLEAERHKSAARQSQF